MGSINRGGVIRRNDNGTLERIGKTNTYVGSATLPDGKVITKRFRCDGFNEEEVSQRWLKWQGRKIDDDEYKDLEDDSMADKPSNMCPFSNEECTPACPVYSVPNSACAVKLGGVALFSMSTYLPNLDNGEAIELLAMAVADAVKARPQEKMAAAPTMEPPAEAQPTADDGVALFMKDKSFLSFVNLHSKTVYSQYKKLCEESELPTISEKELVEKVKKTYPELKGKGVSGGTVFMPA